MFNGYLHTHTHPHTHTHTHKLNRSRCLRCVAVFAAADRHRDDADDGCDQDDGNADLRSETQGGSLLWRAHLFAPGAQLCGWRSGGDVSCRREAVTVSCVQLGHHRHVGVRHVVSLACVSRLVVDDFILEVLLENISDVELPPVLMDAGQRIHDVHSDSAVVETLHSDIHSADETFTVGVEWWGVRMRKFLVDVVVICVQRLSLDVSNITLVEGFDDVRHVALRL